MFIRSKNAVAKLPRFIAATLATFTLLALSPPSAAQSRSPTLIDLLRDQGCTIIVEVEKENWREANASDYSGPEWDAWRKATGNATPWRTTGDFNGDGLIDVARVVVRKTDGAWMMGVEFGYDAKTPCARFQIASNSGKLEVPIHSVLTLKKNQNEITCLTENLETPIKCRAPANSELASRNNDAIVTSAVNGVGRTAYLWEVYKKIPTKSDGSPWMVFASHPIDAMYDGALAMEKFHEESSKPQRGDVVSAQRRKELVAQFDAAYVNAFKRAHRVISTMVAQANEQSFKSITTVQFEPPRRMRMIVEVQGTKSETVQIDNESWISSGGAFEKAEMPWSVFMDGAGIGPGVIKSVRDEKQNGRSVRTIELEYATSGDGSKIGKTIAIDAERKLPLRTVDSVGVVTTTSVFDFDAKFPSIRPPK